MIEVHKMPLAIDDARLQAWLNSLAMRGTIVSVTTIMTTDGDFWYVILHVS